MSSTFANTPSNYRQWNTPLCFFYLSHNNKPKTPHATKGRKTWNHHTIDDNITTIKDNNNKKILATNNNSLLCNSLLPLFQKLPATSFQILVRTGTSTWGSSNIETWKCHISKNYKSHLHEIKSKWKLINSVSF